MDVFFHSQYIASRVTKGTIRYVSVILEFTLSCIVIVHNCYGYLLNVAKARRELSRLLCDVQTWFVVYAAALSILTVQPQVHIDEGQASPSGKVGESTKSLPSAVPPQPAVTRTTTGLSTKEKPSNVATVLLPRCDSSATPGQETAAKSWEQNEPPFPAAPHATAAADDVAISTDTLTPSQADAAPTASVTPWARETQTEGATSPATVPLPGSAPTGPGAHSSTALTSADALPSASTSAVSLPEMSCQAASGREQRVSTDEKEVGALPVAPTAASETVTSPSQQRLTPASEQGMPLSSPLSSSKIPAKEKVSSDAAAVQADAPHGNEEADAASGAPSPTAVAAATTAPKLLVANQPSPGVSTPQVPSHLPASSPSIVPLPKKSSQPPPLPQAAPTPTPTPTQTPSPTPPSASASASASKNEREAVAPTAASVSGAKEMVSSVKEQQSKCGTGKRCASGKSVGAGRGSGDAGGRSRKRPKVKRGHEEERVRKKTIQPEPVAVCEPDLEIPEVSEADVGKMVLSETSAGILTGVVERFWERNGLGVWSIR